MPEVSPSKVTAQWRLAGQLCAALTVAQMILFIVVMLRSSLVDASMNYWLLIIGFAVTGVAAAVCSSRAVRRSAHSSAR
jgi:membrane protein implicated in regulation of membrane protease activity